jgi:hypothetical protein
MAGVDSDDNSEKSDQENDAQIVDLPVVASVKRKPNYLL